MEEEVDKDLIHIALETPKKVVEKMEKLRVADAITEIFVLFKRCNKYIDETMPWALAKEEAKRGRLATVLYNLVESISIGAALLKPFMPQTSEKILAQLGTAERKLDQMDAYGQVQNGTQVTKTPEILFARLELDKVLAAVEEQQQKAVDANTKENKENQKDDDKQKQSVIEIEAKPEISYEDFAKLQFQIGEIIACEEVKKSKKLLCSQVKIGNQVKQIVSGIKAFYTAEEMVGKKVMVLVNLKPATLAGVLSEGMLLCAEDEQGRLALIVSEKDMPTGAEIS